MLGALAQESEPDREDKVLPLEALRARVAGWRSRGLRVVFTNGCFDLLHVGHISLLEQARRMGDRLIVAVNSDRSVRGLKGQRRPMVREQERAQVLAALSAVDAVVIFDEATPLRLIEALAARSAGEGRRLRRARSCGRGRGEGLGRPPGTGAAGCRPQHQRADRKFGRTRRGRSMSLHVAVGHFSDVAGDCLAQVPGSEPPTMQSRRQSAQHCRSSGSTSWATWY